MRIHYYLHTHWDREWHKTQSDFQKDLLRVADDVLNQLEKGSIESFYFDGQVIPVEDYLAARPGNRGRVRKLVKQRRLLFGPWYVLPDEFLVSGESLARNLLYGIDASRKMGVDRFTGYLPDTFGHAQSIPTLLKACGIDTAIIWRGVDPDRSAFFWRGPDGSRVKTQHLTLGYYHTFMHDALPAADRVARMKKWLQEVSRRSVNGSVLLPIGADHYPLPQNFRQELSAVAEALRPSTFIASTPLDFLDKLTDRLPVRAGEFRETGRHFILPNVTSTRLHLKRENALCQWDLARILEPLAAFAFAHGRDRGPRASMQGLWKLLLQNHPHDTVCGCSIDAVYRDVTNRFGRIHRRIDSGLRALLLNGNGRFVFNGTPREWSGVVTDEKGRGRFLASAPALSFVPARKAARPPQASAVRVRRNRISNGRLAVTIMPDGTLTVRDRKLRRSFAGLHRIVDQADCGDEYNFDPLPGDKVLSAAFAGFDVLQATPELAEIRLRYSMDIPASLHPQKAERSSYPFPTDFVTRLQVRAGSPLLRFATTWENRSFNHRLQVVFPSPRAVRSVLAEDHFGTVRRTPPPRRELDRVAVPGREIPVATAPMQRFVTDLHMTVFGRGLPEYEMYPRGLGLTVLRCIGWLSDDVLRTRGGGAGPFIPTPGAQCIGPCVAEYGWAPHQDLADTFLQADLFMDAVRILRGRRPPFRSAVTVRDPRIQLAAAKVSQDGKGVVMRLFNPHDEPVTTSIACDFRHGKALETNLLEEPLADATLARVVFRPRELKHIKIMRN